LAQLNLQYQAKKMGMELPRLKWSVVNCLRKNQLLFCMMYKCRHQDSPVCDSGNKSQTVSHIKTQCQLRKFN